MSRYVSFIIKETDNQCEEIVNSLAIGTFQNFYELEEYLGSKSRVVSLEYLRELRRLLFPVIQVLIQYNDTQISYYDDFGYPKGKNSIYKKELDGNDFNPSNSLSAFAGRKTLLLYSVIDTLIDILEWDNKYVCYVEI